MGYYGSFIVTRRVGGDFKTFPINKKEFLIGKQLTCDVRIYLSQIADVQCKISFEREGQATLVNFGEEGTVINGQNIEKQERRALKDKDIIKIHDRTFRFEYTLSNEAKPKATSHAMKSIRSTAKSKSACVKAPNPILAPAIKQTKGRTGTSSTPSIKKVVKLPVGSHSKAELSNEDSHVPKKSRITHGDDEKQHTIECPDVKQHSAMNAIQEKATSDIDTESVSNKHSVVSTIIHETSVPSQSFKVEEVAHSGAECNLKLDSSENNSRTFETDQYSVMSNTVNGTGHDFITTDPIPPGASPKLPKSLFLPTTSSPRKRKSLDSTSSIQQRSPSRRSSRRRSSLLDHANLVGTVNSVEVTEESNFDTNNVKEKETTRRKVTFGPNLSPEIFDKTLPPNSPLKRGRKTPTGTPALSQSRLRDVFGVSRGSSSVTSVKRVTFGPDLSPEIFDKALPPNSPLKKGRHATSMSNTPLKNFATSKPSTPSSSLLKNVLKHFRARENSPITLDSNEETSSSLQLTSDLLNTVTSSQESIADLSNSLNSLDPKADAESNNTTCTNSWQIASDIQPDTTKNNEEPDHEFASSNPFNNGGHDKLNATKLSKLDGISSTASQATINESEVVESVLYNESDALGSITLNRCTSQNSGNFPGENNYEDEAIMDLLATPSPLANDKKSNIPDSSKETEATGDFLPEPPLSTPIQSDNEEDLPDSPLASRSTHTPIHDLTSSSCSTTLSEYLGTPSKSVNQVDPAGKTETDEQKIVDGFKSDNVIGQTSVLESISSLKDREAGPAHDEGSESNGPYNVCDNLVQEQDNGPVDISESRNNNTLVYGDSKADSKANTAKRNDLKHSSQQLQPSPVQVDETKNIINNNMSQISDDILPKSEVVAESQVDAVKVTTVGRSKNRQANQIVGWSGAEVDSPEDESYTTPKRITRSATKSISKVNNTETKSTRSGARVTRSMSHSGSDADNTDADSLVVTQSTKSNRRTTRSQAKSSLLTRARLTRASMVKETSGSTSEDVETPVRTRSSRQRVSKKSNSDPAILSVSVDDSDDTLGPRTRRSKRKIDESNNIDLELGASSIRTRSKKVKSGQIEDKEATEIAEHIPELPPIPRAATKVEMMSEEGIDNHIDERITNIQSSHNDGKTSTNPTSTTLEVLAVEPSSEIQEHRKRTRSTRSLQMSAARRRGNVAVIIENIPKAQKSTEYTESKVELKQENAKSRGRRGKRSTTTDATARVAYEKDLIVEDRIITRQSKRSSRLTESISKRVSKLSTQNEPFEKQNLAEHDEIKSVADMENNKVKPTKRNIRRVNNKTTKDSNKIETSYEAVRAKGKSEEPSQKLARSTKVTKKRKAAAESEMVAKSETRKRTKRSISKSTKLSTDLKSTTASARKTRSSARKK